MYCPLLTACGMKGAKVPHKTTVTKQTVLKQDELKNLAIVGKNTYNYKSNGKLRGDSALSFGSIKGDYKSSGVGNNNDYFVYWAKLDGVWDKYYLLLNKVKFDNSAKNTTIKVINTSKVEYKGEEEGFYDANSIGDKNKIYPRYSKFRKSFLKKNNTEYFSTNFKSDWKSRKGISGEYGALGNYYIKTRLSHESSARVNISKANFNKLIDN